MKVRVARAALDLAPRNLRPVLPNDAVAVLVGRHDRDLVALERRAEDIREVVEHPVRVERVGEVGLRRAVVQAVLDRGDLDGEATGDGVAHEVVLIRLAPVKLADVLDIGADGPDVDGEVAVVVNVGLAGRCGGHSEGGNGSGGEGTHVGGLLIE